MHNDVTPRDDAALPSPSEPAVVVNVAVLRDRAEQRTDLFTPLFAEEGDGFRFQVEDPGEREALIPVFQSASEYWAETTEDDAIGDVFAQFCRLLPKTNLVKVYHDPDQADWHWSKVRSVLGGAGYFWHPRFTKILTDLYPQCPMVEDESKAAWRDAVQKARGASYWPVSFGLASWHDLCHAMMQVPKGTLIPQWVRIAALFHILKHVRYSRSLGLVVTYRDTAAAFAFDEFNSNSLGTSKFVRVNLAPALGCPTSKDRKLIHPLTQAVSDWFDVLTTSDLLSRKATAHLPGVVQHGPWSTLVPDPVNIHGFIQHGARLTGVWVAQNGKISLTTGETADIVGYDWTLTPGEHAADRRRFEHALPTTYDATATPFEVFLAGFPNLNASNFGGDTQALGCLVDAVLCASLIRTEVPSLAIEKPLILCMPSSPTLDDSTNQGKSKAAHTLARAFSSGVPLIGVSDSDSAPDIRAIASTIRRHGTLCADEWRQPKRKSHILSHENLQLLITGGSVAVGEVLANNVDPLSLQHPIVVSCKAIDAPPDIVNRSLVLLFDRLTDEQRANGVMLDEIETGKLSLRIRLAALALAERLDLATHLNSAPKGSTNKGWRFNSLRAAALKIWHSRYGTDGATEIDNAVQTMQGAFGGHTREAEENGLLASLEEGSTLKVRLFSLFTDMTSNELDLLIASCDARADSTSGALGVWSPATILRGRAELLGLGGKPLSALCEHLCGQRGRVSDRTVAQSLSRDMKGVMPNVGDEWLLPDLLGMGGWRLIRRTDVGNQPRVSITKRIDVRVLPT